MAKYVGTYRAPTATNSSVAIVSGRLSAERVPCRRSAADRPGRTQRDDVRGSPTAPGLRVVFKIEDGKVTGHRARPRRPTRALEGTRHASHHRAPRLAHRRGAARGAAVAVVPRHERVGRRRRQADAGQVERADRRERPLEDADRRRRRLEPDRLGRSRVRLDRGQQRSECRHPDGTVRRRRTGQRHEPSPVASDRARQEDRQGHLGSTSRTRASRRRSVIPSRARRRRRR